MMEAKSVKAARHARAALREHKSRCGTPPTEDTLTCLTDLLADLRHMCAVDGVDFEAAERMALEHFFAEKGWSKSA